MTTMFQYVDIKESPSLSANTRRQLAKLKKKFPWLIRAQVYFKSLKTKAPERCICEIELSGPGPRLFATSTEAHYETAMKETISDLERQLRKRKELFNTH